MTWKDEDGTQYRECPRETPSACEGCDRPAIRVVLAEMLEGDKYGAYTWSADLCAACGPKAEAPDAY